jgi:hypothetical protein
MRNFVTQSGTTLRRVAVQTGYGMQALADLAADAGAGFQHLSTLAHNPASRRLAQLGQRAGELPAPAVLPDTRTRVAPGSQPVVLAAARPEGGPTITPRGRHL